MAGPMAKITPVDCGLAATTKTTKGTRETRVNKKIAAMIAARREETISMTWSRTTTLVDATSGMTNDEVIVEIHGETTNAGAPEAPEANGHLA